MRGTRGALLALMIGLAVLAPLAARGGGSSSPRTLILEPVGTFDYPTFATGPPGDSHRLFVVQQGGVIRLLLDGVLQSTPFLTVPNVLSGGERGLLSMAFPPDYAISGLFYVYYTRTPDGAITVDEFERNPSDPNVADPATQRNVLVVPHPTYGNHNGGQLEFGPDGMLYIGTGDGGGGGDPFRTGQNLAELRGKILRIDPRESGPQPYTVPANNPFVGQSPWKPEIWSYGVRNPWRFSFDRLTGDLTVGDVGQDLWEEIDYRPLDMGWGRAVNFGWSCMEGRHLYDGNCAEPPNDTLPIFEYPHSGAHGGCSITGGYIVRDPDIASMAGRYIYGDYCTGTIYSQVPQIPDATDDRDENIPVGSLDSFGEDACGHLYTTGNTPNGASPNVFRIGSTDPPGTCQPAFPLPVLTASVSDPFTIHLRDPNGVE